MGVRERLASLGTDLGKFNQNAFRGDVVAFGDTDLKGGYCAGVCLDWTRRVLLSASDRDAKFLTYASPKQEIGGARQEDTLRRMATAYKGQGASYVATTRKSEVLPKLKALLAEPEKGWNISGQVVQGVGVPNAVAKLVLELMTPNPNPLNLQKEPAGAVPKSTIQFWISFIEGINDPQHKRLADGGREWGQYSKELDQQFGGKKKRFGDLNVVDSRNQQTYADPGVWLGVLMSKAFRHQCCTIIGAGAPKATGHAVAVHQIGQEYRFFDPNFGVFEYSKESLQNALQYLFWAPFWKGEEGEDTDLPVYRRRTSTSPRDPNEWSQMSYTIFTKNG